MIADDLRSGHDIEPITLAGLMRSIAALVMCALSMALAAVM